MASTGDESSGFYRDPRGVGRKTGRLSPRVPKRLPAIDRIQLARGLVSPGDVDVNQGMLFDPESIPTTSLEEMSQQEGVPLLRPSSSAGFLPGLKGSPTGSVTSTEQKLAAIKHFSEALDIPDKTIRGSVQHAQSLMTGVKPEEGWYQDKAADAIQATTRSAAEKESKVTGVPSHLSAQQMRRTVALFSAQRPWDTGHPQEGTYRISNVENVEGLPEHLAKDLPAEDYTVPRIREGFPVAGETALPQTTKVQQKAAEVIKGNVTPGEPHTSAGDKIPTFDSALSFGMTSNVPLRRHLSNAMTVDTHQARVVGLPDYSVVANRVGGYDVAAMASRRASLREGIEQLNKGNVPALPIEGQETSWKKVRPPQGLSRMSLFKESPDGSLTPTDFSKLPQWDEEVTAQTTGGMSAVEELKKKRKSSKKKT